MRQKLIFAIVAAALALPAASAQASVLCVQEFLLETAFDPGPADGAWGKRTATALEDLFGQIGETVDGGLGKDNAENICALFSGPRHDELLELGSYRVYTVSVDTSVIDDVSTKTIFDFSKFDIATNAFFDDCRFAINRRHKSDGTIEDEAMVDGSLSIEGGRIVFGDHQWHANGEADSTYLPAEANLQVAISGQIIGMTPYFHMYFDPGQPGEPPMYVTFSKAFTPKGDFPNGITEFDAGGAMEDGLFSLECAPQ